MKTLRHDLKLAVRAWTKKPLGTLVIVLSLAIGIAASVTIFSYVNAVLIRPLPVEDPDRLVLVSGTRTGSEDQFNVSYPNYRDLRDINEVFSSVVAWQWTLLNFSTSGEPVELIGQIVTSNYFETLGVEPELGRAFTEEEGRMGAGALVVILNHETWESRFGARPEIVGSDIVLNGQPFTVVGVMPQGFGGTTTIGAADLWAPLAMHEALFPFSQYVESRPWGLFNVFARLAPGVELEEAEAGLQVVARQLEREYPANENRGFSARPVELGTVDPGMRRNIRRGSWLLTGAALLLLAIACANVSILLVNRGLTRRTEVAVRLALGARRSELVRQFVVEAAPLFLAGGGLGLLATRWSRDLLWRYRPTNIPENAIDPALDLRVMLFALGLSLVTALLFGIPPALQITRPDLRTALHEESGTTRGLKWLDLRRGLVVAQVALAFFGLTGAGLFLRSFQNAQELDPSFETRRGFLYSVKLGAQGYDETAGVEMAQRMVREVAATPGVTSAALAEIRLLNPFGTRRSIQAEGMMPEETEGLLIRTNSAGPGYFRTLGIDIVRGREFEVSDDRDSRPVAIVNETLAERFWDGDAVGGRFRFSESTPYVEIVGVARDSKYLSLQEDPQPYLYMPWSQKPSLMITVYARTAGPPDALLETVRRRVQPLDPELPLVGLQTLGDLIRDNLWPVRMTYGLLAILGLLALLLSAIGIFAVSANTVRARTPEIGVRMAFGARRREILKLVVYDGLRLVAAGALLGTGLVLAGTRMLGSLLYDVPPWDPATLLAVAAIVAVLSLGTLLLPAWRATRLDPTSAIHTGA